jgi:hypothetical protein
MALLESVALTCPYCGEEIEVVVDCSVTEQQYVEDCSVCCRPLLLAVCIGDNGVPSVRARHENE